MTNKAHSTNGEMKQYLAGLLLSLAYGLLLAVRGLFNSDDTMNQHSSVKVNITLYDIPEEHPLVQQALQRGVEITQSSTGSTGWLDITADGPNKYRFGDTASVVVHLKQ